MRRKPFDVFRHSRRLQMLVFASGSRLVGVWLLAFPAYQSLARSPLLHGSDTDRQLLQHGSEALLALLDARWGSLADLVVPTLLLLAVAAALAMAVTSMIWIWMDDALPLFGPRTMRRWCSALPAFATLALGLFTMTLALGWGWWQTAPVIGALLEPALGERGTDCVQLAVLCGCLGLLFALCTTADLVRAHLATGRVSLQLAVTMALQRYRQVPVRIAGQALLRFVCAVSIYLSVGGAIARFQWLSSSDGETIAAIVLSESAIAVVTWLRLGWIAWLLRIRLHT